MKLSSFILSAVALVALQTNVVSADCCPSDDGVCDDGTQATPCCGYGRCNIFCCNCDGGCRSELAVKASHGRYSHAYNVNAMNPLSETEQVMQCADKMEEFDANGDGLFTFFEYLNINPTTSAGEALDRWVKFDWERKGYLTFEEAYERKA